MDEAKKRTKDKKKMEEDMLVFCVSCFNRIERKCLNWRGHIDVHVYIRDVDNE